MGRAGYLAGYLWLKHQVCVEVLAESEVFALCDMLCNMMVELAGGARKNKSPCPLMYQYYKTEYL